MKSNLLLFSLFIGASVCSPGCGGGSAPTVVSSGSSNSGGGVVPTLNPPDTFKATLSAAKTVFNGPRDAIPPVIVFTTNIPGALTWTSFTPGPSGTDTGTRNSAGSVDQSGDFFTVAPVVGTGSRNQSSQTEVVVTSVANPRVFATALVEFINY